MDKKLYKICLQNGCSPQLATLLASHTFPGVKGTDRAFLQGRGQGGAQFNGQEYVGRHHLQKAAEAGVSVTGKVYIGSLARFPGDPQAWVSGLDDVRARCRERGWGCTGAIDVKPQEGTAPPRARYQVDDDLVADYVQDRIDADPALESRRAALTEEMKAKLSGRTRG